MVLMVVRTWQFWGRRGDQTARGSAPAPTRLSGCGPVRAHETSAPPWTRQVCRRASCCVGVSTGDDHSDAPNAGFC